jgi:hypothetical protein
MATLVELHVLDSRTGAEHTFVLGELRAVLGRPFTLGSDPRCGLVVDAPGVAGAQAEILGRSNHRYVKALAPGVVVLDQEPQPVKVGCELRIDTRSFGVGALVFTLRERPGRLRRAEPPPGFPARLGTREAPPR